MVGLSACGAAADSGGPIGADSETLSGPSECACLPTLTQEVSCEPRAVCTGPDACAGIESEQAAAFGELARSTEGFYFHGVVSTGTSFSAATPDCSGSTDEALPETQQVKPYQVGACRCAVTLECTRVRTTTLGCE